MVYECHPEPEDAAGIMLVESFSPQIQALLFNYSKAAVELDAQRAVTDDLRDCECQRCFRPMLPEDLGPAGHVCTFNTQHLKCGYLADLAKKGKKFRLPSSPEQAVKDLEDGLEGYIAWVLKREDDAERELHGDGPDWGEGHVAERLRLPLRGGDRLQLRDLEAHQGQVPLHRGDTIPLPRREQPRGFRGRGGHQCKKGPPRSPTY